MNPGIIAVISFNAELSLQRSTISFAIIIGAFLYCLAAASAPLH